MSSVGFFGKLPSHGDFVERRVNETFRDVWDNWLQHCLSESHRELGDRWLDCYLTSPMWRFFISDGIAGAASYAGVLLPSVDRVGRYFPLTVVAELPVGLAALEFAEAAKDWFAAVERLCGEVLQEGSGFDLAAFDEAVAATAAQLAGLDRCGLSRAFPGNATQWHWNTRSVDELPGALGIPMTAVAQAALRPMTMWWTDGSELVHPSVMVVRSLPRPDSFAALLAGTWDDGRWEGEVSPPSQQSEAAEVEWDPPGIGAEFAITSAGDTDAGTVRQQNQDHFLLHDDNRLWAVADGMGGHSRGDVASLMVVDALSAVAPTVSLNAALESISVALARVNADLRRSALGVGGLDRSGSTVVALVIRGNEWGVSWAGDSRAYLYRGGSLVQLTRDHSMYEQTGGEVGSGEITRAVGGEDSLELEHIGDALADGDRFLLCSDGLYGALDPNVIIECLNEPVPQEASRRLIDEAREVGARDNVTAVVIDVRVVSDGDG